MYVCIYAGLGSNRLRVRDYKKKVIRYVTSKNIVIRLQILLKNQMIPLRITYKFPKKSMTLLCFLNDIQISIEKGANLSLFHLSESDHKSETTMMTHQMGLMDHGKRAGIGFCRLQSKLPSNGATAVCIQRLSNLNKRLEVRMTAVVQSAAIGISHIIDIYIAN